jgi:addiction module HigA family antidote
MIVSFRTKQTEKIWNGERVKKIPIEIQQIGRRKLRMLNNSQNLADLRIPPSNRLEKLKGSTDDFYSIRINDQWRIVFRWDSNHAHDVEIIGLSQINELTMDTLANIHPGEILLEEFLKPMGISAYRLSKDTEIPQTRISMIIKGRRRITADTALRLSSYFGTTAKFWLGLQDDYDIEEVSKGNSNLFKRIRSKTHQNSGSNKAKAPRAFLCLRDFILTPPTFSSLPVPMESGSTIEIN